MATRTRGRPQGARTAIRVVVNVDLSQCPRCGSYMRTPYKNKRPIYIGTTTHNGRQYSWILQRDTTCRSCGQPRTDESRVYQHGGDEQ